LLASCKGWDGYAPISIFADRAPAPDTRPIFAKDDSNESDIFMSQKHKPPPHLKPTTRDWFSQIVADYDLESHDLKLLILAGESWDRGVEAREALAKHGLTFTDRWGNPKGRPEIAVERDSRIAFARLCRELDLSENAGPLAPRPPALQSNRIS
jgi:phage terminase small subunit